MNIDNLIDEEALEVYHYLWDISDPTANSLRKLLRDKYGAFHEVTIRVGLKNRIVKAHNKEFFKDMILYGSRKNKGYTYYEKD